MEDRLIMFVHGLGGDSHATWRRPGRDGFAELIRRDPPLRDNADLAFFEYPTSLFRLPFTAKPPRIRDLAEGLRSLIENRYPDHKSIALVCHSLGGLVARRYLIEEVKRGSTLRVDKLLLFAVPHHGSGLASVGRYISWRHNQLSQLCRNSEFLEELNSEWARLDMQNRVELKFVVAGQDRVVDKQSAVNQWGDHRVETILDADHISVVKPQAPTDLAYLILRRFILGPVRVFLSVGGGRSEQQEAFVSAIKKFCSTRSIEAKTVDEYTSTNRQPLKDVEYRMNRCYGAIVLAFERAHVESGVWRRGAPQQRPMKDVRFSPVWNQIEAAMAYTRGLPLLVIAEKGLESEGLLESKYDWRVKWVSIDQSVVQDPEFRGMFEDWRQQVLATRGDLALP